MASLQKEVRPVLGSLLVDQLHGWRWTGCCVSRCGGFRALDAQVGRGGGCPPKRRRLAGGFAKGFGVRGIWEVPRREPDGRWLGSQFKTQRYPVRHRKIRPDLHTRRPDLRFRMADLILQVSLHLFLVDCLVGAKGNIRCAHARMSPPAQGSRNLFFFSVPWVRLRTPHLLR